MVMQICGDEVERPYLPSAVIPVVLVRSPRTSRIAKVVRRARRGNGTQSLDRVGGHHRLVGSRLGRQDDAAQRVPACCGKPSAGWSQRSASAIQM